jgi:uncharacterized protein YndB with AHSA1/START domain
MDIISRVGAVVRAVEGRDHNGKPARVVIATRTYDTDPDDLWDAITNRERLPRWFLPVEGDLRLGGRYQLKGNAGGEITRCEAPRRLDVTWEYGGDMSWVNVTLEPKARDRTLLTLEHIAHVDVKPEFWDQFGPGAVGVGWDLGLHGLALHIETGKPVDSAENEAWSMSPEGKAFIGASSEGWRKASIAFGTPEAAADAAAARTAAFYTGAPPPEAKPD